jgi:glycosyltransferase involved in cell wall biosynthesis
MHIGLDCRILREEPSGMWRFALNMIKKIIEIDKKNSYIFFVNDNYGSNFVEQDINIRLYNLNLKLFSIAEQFILPSVLKRTKIDIFHSFSFAAPLFSPCKTVITIYDLIHLLFPQNYSCKLALYYKLIVARCIRQTNKFLTISENSKSDIINLLGVSPEKVAVIYGAVDDLFQPMEKSNLKMKMSKQFGINKDFMLYVGNMRPHKNLLLLIEAFYKSLSLNPDLILVICAEKAYSFNAVSDKITKLGIEEKVFFVDNISDENLALFYNAARALILPSLYEGFGLPPLEAMACGTPVLASDIKPLREVLGDAALFFNPSDIEGMSRVMVKVLTDRQLQDNLSKKGSEWARQYSWEKSARELLSLYEEVYNS